MANPTTLERDAEVAQAIPLAPATQWSWLLAFNPRPDSLGSLAARLGVGIIFLAHGLQKLGFFGGAGWSATLAFFESHLGIPQPLGACAILAEAVGGALLIAGLFARPMALVAVIHMLVAAFKVHVANGFFLNFNMEPGRGHGFEFNLALVALALVVLADGPGRLALDTAIARLFDRETPASPPTAARLPY